MTIAVAISQAGVGGAILYELQTPPSLKGSPLQCLDAMPPISVFWARGKKL